MSTVVMEPGAFRWVRGRTPMSAPASVGLSIGSYLVIVFLLRWSLKRPVAVSAWVAGIHNLSLCGGSLIMFMGAFVESMRESVRLESGTWLFCLPKGTSIEGPLYFWSYWYYLSKYYEFVDTVLLVLKGKPLTVLHIFHHSVVVVMAWLWLDQAQSLQQLALLTNTGVHVIMYYYYYRCALGKPPRWKRLVTNIQILQFVSSFGLSVPFWIMAARQPGCSGFEAMLFNAVFNLVLLYLFIDFHRKSYKPQKQKPV